MWLMFEDDLVLQPWFELVLVFGASVNLILILGFVVLMADHYRNVRRVRNRFEP